jgi:cytochrome oxidase Cu insertion factor (SCO1/SenC/PrrC family)
MATRKTSNTMKGRARARRLYIALFAGLAGSVAVAGWVLTQMLAAGAGPAKPRVGERIDATFVGLTDTRGVSVDERALGARYRLVTFGFTECPNVCPLTLLGIHQALEQLGNDASRILPVFVSVDPEHDTPQALASYVGAFDSRILALTGSQQSIKRVALSYRIYFAKRMPVGRPQSSFVEHSAYVLLIDPEQRIRAVIPATIPPEEIATQIVQAVRETRAS